MYHEGIALDELKVLPTPPRSEILWFYEFRTNLCFKKEQKDYKEVIKSSKRINLFSSSPSISKTLGSQFQSFSWPKLDQSLELFSLHGTEEPVLDGDNLAVSNRLESVILASVHTLVPPQVRITVDTHGKDDFKNQIIKRNVLFWTKRATCSQVFHSWTWANTDITASLLLFLRLFTANFVPSM